MQEQQFKDGRLTGKAISYYTDGTVKAISNYKIMKEKKRGLSVKYQSVPHGTWIFYDTKGAEISRIEYENGQRVRKK